MGPSIRFLLLGWLSACQVASACAQKLPPPDREATIPLARIPRVTRPPQLEEFLENRPRQAELRVDSFRQYIPGDGEPASEKTAAYLSYDDKNLYVAFV